MEKDIKINELINILVSKFPDDLSFFNKLKEYKINSLIQVQNYLHEFVWSYPKLIQYFNKFNKNGEINKSNIYSYLREINKIFIDNGISKFHLKSHYINIIQELNKLNKLNEEASLDKIQMIDLLARIKVKNYLGQNQSMKTDARKKLSKNDLNEAREKVKEAIQKDIEIKSSKVKKTSLFIDKLDEKIIIDNEMVLVDTKTLENTNETLYIFIDKNNQKVYYKEPFEADIFISNVFNIIDNDYIELYDKNKHFKYRIFDIKMFKKFKYILSSNFNKVVKNI